MFLRPIIRPFNCVIFLAILIPIEVFILKWLPVSEQLYVALRQIPDILIILLAFVLFIKTILTNGLIRVIGKKVDIFLLLFIIVAFLAILLNKSNIFISFANIKALLRYIFLMYLILMLKPSEQDIFKFWKAIKFSVTIQVLIGIIQLIGGDAVREILAAREVTEGIGGLSMYFTGNRTTGLYDLFGTMGNTINYGMFLIVGLVFWIVTEKKSPIKYWIGTCSLILLIYLTGSLSCLIAGLFVIWLHQFYINLLQGIKISIIGMIILPIFIIACIILLQLIIDTDQGIIYTVSKYLESQKNARLGLVLYIFPNYFSGIRTYLGYSPDKEIFISFLVQNMPMVHQGLLQALPRIIEDVYWLAMLIYYGVFGIIFFLLFYFSLIKINILLYKNSRTLTLHRLALMNILLLLVAIPLNMFNQAFEVRQFSFYLWVSIGIAISVSRQYDKIIHKNSINS